MAPAPPCAAAAAGASDEPPPRPALATGLPEATFQRALEVTLQEAGRTLLEAHEAAVLAAGGVPGARASRGHGDPLDPSLVLSLLAPSWSLHDALLKSEVGFSEEVAAPALDPCAHILAEWEEGYPTAPSLPASTAVGALLRPKGPAGEEPTVVEQQPDSPSGDTASEEYPFAEPPDSLAGVPLPPERAKLRQAFLRTVTSPADFRAFAAAAQVSPRAKSALKSGGHKEAHPDKTGAHSQHRRMSEASQGSAVGAKASSREGLRERQVTRLFSDESAVTKVSTGTGKLYKVAATRTSTANFRAARHDRRGRLVTLRRTHSDHPHDSAVHLAEKPKHIWEAMREWFNSEQSAKLCQMVGGDVFISFMIVLNATVIGVSIDHNPEWSGWLFANAVFAAIFLIELCVKLRHYGLKEFFQGENMWWNISEAFIVVFAMLEVLFDLVELLTKNQSAVIFVVLRFLRLARVTRLIRVTRIPMFGELLLMVNGCVAGMKTLMWSQCLLALPLYVLALVFREMFGGGTQDDAYADGYDDGTKGFLTVGSSFFTCFRCLVAGECFTAEGRPIFVLLTNRFGAGVGIAYYFASAFLSFGLANVIAAIFVESTVEAAKSNEVRKKQLRLADRKFFAKTMLDLMEIFWAEHEDNVNQIPLKEVDDEALANIEISPELFHRLQMNKEVQHILQDLDVALEEQLDLFETVDVDGSGTIDFEELIAGIEKMRGGARRSDVVRLDFQLRALATDFERAQIALSERIQVQMDLVVRLHQQNMQLAKSLRLKHDQTSRTRTT